MAVESKEFTIQDICATCGKPILVQKQVPYLGISAPYLRIRIAGMKVEVSKHCSKICSDSFQSDKARLGTQKFDGAL